MYMQCLSFSAHFICYFQLSHALLSRHIKFHFSCSCSSKLPLTTRGIEMSTFIQFSISRSMTLSLFTSNSFYKILKSVATPAFAASASIIACFCTHISNWYVYSLSQDLSLIKPTYLHNLTLLVFLEFPSICLYFLIDLRLDLA